MYKLEECPDCGEMAYLCWNCRKCPDCVDHRGEFSCVKPHGVECVLCGRPVKHLEGCTLQYDPDHPTNWVFGGTEEDGWMSFDACGACSDLDGSREAGEEAVAQLTDGGRRHYGRINL